MNIVRRRFCEGNLLVIYFSWTYHSEEELGGSSVTGKLHSYSGAGYYQNLGSNSSHSLDILAELKQNLWIDRGTRVVFIDFSVYNANINLFCIVRSAKITLVIQCLFIVRLAYLVYNSLLLYLQSLLLLCRLMIEFPATGGVIPSWTFRTVKLIRYNSNMDFFVLGCEVVFALFLFYYIIEESLEVW